MFYLVLIRLQQHQKSRNIHTVKGTIAKVQQYRLKFGMIEYSKQLIKGLSFCVAIISKIIPIDIKTFDCLQQTINTLHQKRVIFFQSDSIQQFLVNKYFQSSEFLSNPFNILVKLVQATNEYSFWGYNSVMDQLLESRLQGNEPPQKLDGLSPQRFGRSAYAGLSYTPSKLAGNVLFKEAVSMRRVEESSSRAREGEAMVQLLRDKLRHLHQEKTGVETALSQQIAMYKRILTEAEAAHEKSLLTLQASFNEQMQRIITLKEEEAKFVQSEKELLENRILQLEEAISALKAELDREAGSRQNFEQGFSEISKQKETLTLEKASLEARLREQIAGREKERQQQANSQKQRELDWLQREEQLTEELTRGLEEAASDKQKAIDNLTALHRQQIATLEQQRINEARVREDEVKKLRAGWEIESRRLEEALHAQKVQSQMLAQTLQQEKERASQALRKLTADVASLSIRNQQLEKQVQATNRQITECREDAKRTENFSTQTTANLQTALEKLRREAEAARKEAGNQRAEAQELRMEVMVLRKSTERTSMLLEENSILSREVKGLKELLVQSSLQMQRCKAEFLRLQREKEVLIAKLRELDLENDNLYRVRLEMQEEARIWRETYYLNRK